MAYYGMEFSKNTFLQKYRDYSTIEKMTCKGLGYHGLALWDCMLYAKQQRTVQLQQIWL